MARGRSLLSDESEPCCYVCGTPFNLHVHHCFPGYGRRKVSDEEGAWVYLCGRHHNMSNAGVHFDHDLDMHIRRECQRRWMEREHATADDFRKVFYASYLDEEEE